MIKPEKLKKGDRVAIVSLSSGILGEEFFKHQIDLGIKRLKDFGLIPVFMPNALKGLEFIRNNPKSRAEDLKKAFLDSSINGIICAIGGDDTYRTLPYLLEDQEFIEAIKNNPKLFTGYSDTTINHLMFYKLGLTTYYGPNFLVDLAELDNEMLPFTKRSFERFFENPDSLELESSKIWYDERISFSKDQLGTKRVSHIENKGYEVLRGNGIVKGKLLGGCVETLYDALEGTRHIDEVEIITKYNIFPNDWNNKIIFIESSEKKSLPSVYEKMILRFKNYGMLNNAAAIIVGKPQNEKYYNEYKEILVRLTEELNTPIMMNLNFGHAHPKTIIPYGLEMEIDFDNKKVKINEKMFK